MSTTVDSNKKRKSDDATTGTQPNEEKTTQHLEEELLALKAELMDIKKKLVETEERVKQEKERADRAEAKAGTDEESDFGNDEESVAEDPNDPWTAMYLQLREYRILNGHCNVPQKGKLGVWVKNTKAKLKNKKMKQERISKLESLGFSWGKNAPAPMAWEQGLEELKKYQKATGHCNVNINIQSPSFLAKWVSAQRVEYRHFKKGRDSLLTLEQIGQLKETGFKFKGPRLP